MRLLDDEAVIKIHAAMRAGAGYERAVSIATGAHRVTGYTWLRRGREDAEEGRDTVYSRLAKTAEEIRAGFIAQAERISFAALTNDKLDERDRLHHVRWMLGTLARGDYGKDTPAEVAARDAELEGLSKEQITERLEVALARLKSQ